MTEVDVLLELERKLNAHAAEHAGCHEYAEACATHVENAEAQPDKMAQQVCPHVPPRAPTCAPPPPLHEPLRAPARPHAPPCVQHPPLRYKCCASTAPAAHTLTLLSQEQSQNLILCKLKNDSDWAENGEIIKKEQMQSEYWVSDSLLISVHNSSPAGGAPGLSPVSCVLCGRDMG